MNLKAIIESLLFVSAEPIKIKKLAKLCNRPIPEVENALMELQNEYRIRGLRILKKSSKAQMVTAPETAQYTQKLIKSELQEDLSRASLETLAVIAYRGPISRVKIEDIRGVNSSFILRKLLIRGLIERIINPKSRRSFLYRISFDFLKRLGIEKVEDLPDYKNLCFLSSPSS